MAITTQPIPPLAKQSWYRRNEIAVTPWLFLVPGLIMFAVYVIFPIFQSFRISLYKWDGLGTLATHADYVGLANFEKLLTRDRAFNTSLWNNLKWLIFLPRGHSGWPVHCAISQPNRARHSPV